MKRNSKSPFVSYLKLLLELAKGKLKDGTILRMMQSKILGSRRVKRGDKDDRCFEDELLQPSEVVIIDDDNIYRLFGDRIFCAPQIDTIEGTQSSAFGLSCITHYY
jgi:Protein of unknown function (DUF3684)